MMKDIHTQYENRSYKLDLNKLEKPYLHAYTSQFSSKSVQQFESSQKCVSRRSLI